MVEKTFCDVCGDEMQSNENPEEVEFDYEISKDDTKGYSGHWCWFCASEFMEVIEKRCKDAKHRKK